MKKIIGLFVLILLISSTAAFAKEDLEGTENINIVFKKADEIVPGVYERWEEVRNYRENLKDEITTMKRKQWMESAEDREAMKESIELEEEYLLNQYEEGIINDEEYEKKLGELHDEQNKIMLKRNREWVEELKSDQEAVEQYKREMKESFGKVLKGVKHNNKVKVENAFNDFIQSYSSTTDILHEKLKKIE